MVPLILAALLTGIAGTWLELRAALKPDACPECAHCHERDERRRLERLDEERRREEARETHARRMGLDFGARDDEDSRSRD